MRAAALYKIAEIFKNILQILIHCVKIQMDR